MEAVWCIECGQMDPGPIYEGGQCIVCGKYLEASLEIRSDPARLADWNRDTQREILAVLKAVVAQFAPGCLDDPEALQQFRDTVLHQLALLRGARDVSPTHRVT